MPGLKLTLGLLWVHNNNYIYVVLLSVFFSSFQWYNRCRTADDRASSCNIIPLDLCHGVWPTIWELFITAAYCKFIMRIGQQVRSLGWVVLLLATTQIYKNSDYEPRCSTGSAAWVSPAAIRILNRKTLIQNFINAGLIWSLVSFSGQGEKLLEENERPMD